MTSCAATTTIREAIAAYVDAVTDPDAPESAVLEADQTLGAALASLEQLVEAAQVVVETVPYGGRTEYEALAAALAAVGPGEADET